MKSYLLTLCVLSVVSTIGFAEEAADDKFKIPGLEISANVSLVSDYIFRGITQTDNKPAIQGGFDLSHESGFYAGVWGSNVDFGGDESIELDYYGGYSLDIMEDLNIKVGYIYYDYPGASELDFDEATLAITYKMITASAAYGWNFAGIDGNESLYLNLAGSFDLPYEFNLTVAVGHQEHEAGKNYWDYKVAVSREFLGLTFGIAYTDVSDIDLGDNTDSIVGSVSKSF